jgi:hypothetical protein
MGFGIMKYHTGKKYAGNWKYELYFGRGKLTEEDGTIYYGEFKGSCKSGKAL